MADITKNTNIDLINDFSQNKRRLSLIAVGAILLSIIIITGTRAFSKNTTDTNQNNPLDNTSTISFKSNNIPTLRLGHYALWAVSDNDYFFIKRFNSVNNSLVSLNGEKLDTWREKLPDKFNRLVITIEEEGDRDEIPNKLIFMENKYQPTTTLNFNIVDINKNLSGTYILSSPTDGNKKINEQSGIWFIKEDKTTPSLMLPTIDNKNWKWEAKISVNSETTLNIGRFNSPIEKDDFNKYSLLTSPGFNSPGEDFFTNLPEGISGPINLANGKASILISLEPNRSGTDPTGELTFLPILNADIPPNSTQGKELFLNNIFEEIFIEITI